MSTKINNRRVKKVFGANSPQKLENFLFPEGQPDYFHPLKKSPELLTIFHLLFSLGYNTEIASWDGYEIAANSTNDLEQRLRLIIGADTRAVEIYKCHTNFKIYGLEHTPMSEIPLYQTPAKARQVYLGDLILLRKDKVLERKTKTAEIQILTNGLFKSDADDWRIFTGSLIDISQIFKYTTKERLVEYGKSNKRAVTNKN